jgi:hypothetical protein
MVDGGEKLKLQIYRVQKSISHPFSAYKLK